MNMCKQRFAYRGSWCEESRLAFANLAADQAATDCITRDERESI